MDNTNNALEIAEPIWLKVAQLSAGFHHMEQLSRELVELDGVRQDISKMQAIVRRDVAGAVLQTAIGLKKIKSEAADDAGGPLCVVSEDLSTPRQDEWANRLVRWADQFGRDLFKLPKVFLPSNKQDDDPPPPSRQ